MKNPKRTFKREVAVGLLIFLGYVIETKGSEIVELLVWPTFTFAALAFGLDWGHKQLQPTGFTPGRNQRSSEHSGGEGEHSDRRAG
jgi:hypothetical protein